jgi:hypothetical protein
MRREVLPPAGRRPHNACVRRILRLSFRAAAVFLLMPTFSSAARLTKPAEQAFAAYISTLEGRIAWQRPDPAMNMEAGAVRVQPVNGGSWQVTGGLLHHWRAAALAPGAGAGEMVSLLRDYNHLAAYYAPEVVSSRALTDDGTRATLAMRFKKQRVITVVLDTEFEAQSGLTDPARGYGFSRSTHVWQVDQPGSPRERRRPEGDDDGFLWRLNSYWRFEETRDGLLVECDAVSLTRDVPTGLGWLILPIIQTLPRASLEFTLTATRNVLASGAMRRHNHDRAN